MNLDRILLDWGRRAGLYLAGAVLCGYAGGLLAIAQAWLLSSVVAGVFLGGQGLPEAMPGLMGLLGVFAGRAILAWLYEIAAAAAATRVKNEVREMLMVHLYRLGPAVLQGQSTGELVTTSVQSVEALDAFYSQYLPQVVLAGLIPLSVAIVVLPIDPLSGVVLLLTGPLIPLFMVLIGRTAETVTRQQYSALGRMSAFFLDTLQGLTTLKALNQSQTRIEQIAAVSESYRAKTMEVLRLTFLSALALELAATLSTAVVAVEIGLRLLYGFIEFQPAFFILILAPEFYLPLRLLGQRFHAGAAGAAGAQRIRTVFDLPVPVSQNLDVLRVADAAEEPEIISLEGVSFQYPGRDEPALAEIYLDLRVGEMTALVGESGAGKSTLAYLLLGFLQPQSGKMMVNGVAGIIQRQQVAWVPQQPYLFQDTLDANIRLGRPQASVEDVAGAVKSAGLEDFVRQLPQGMQTMIGEQGTRLSGGQAQRLALARAFLVDAPFVILDEPTAQLDPELEAELAETTERLCRERITLVIAHRMASLRRAKKVVVLDHGRIVEVGTPDELLAKGAAGAFARLVGIEAPGR